jgi:ankyrin repeat protein
MGGILEQEQQKVMSKVQLLIMNEYHMSRSNDVASMDPAVLQPMLRSALIKYARQGNLDAVRDLLDAGVDPDTRLIEPPRRTLLQEAARTGRTALAELLVANGASIAVKDEDGFNSLYHAYSSGHGALAERLVSTQANSVVRRGRK